VFASFFVITHAFGFGLPSARKWRRAGSSRYPLLRVLFVPCSVVFSLDDFMNTIHPTDHLEQAAFKLDNTPRDTFSYCLTAIYTTPSLFCSVLLADLIQWPPTNAP
jgi:hypothetical protein